MIKPTDLTINVEIKTGVVFYPEIEERVLDLTERMGLMERVIFPPLITIPYKDQRDQSGSRDRNVIQRWNHQSG